MTVLVVQARIDGGDDELVAYWLGYILLHNPQDKLSELATVRLYAAKEHMLFSGYNDKLSELATVRLYAANEHMLFSGYNDKLSELATVSLYAAKQHMLFSGYNDVLLLRVWIQFCRDLWKDLQSEWLRNCCVDRSKCINDITLKDVGSL